jgi:hypothetical protein
MGIIKIARDFSIYPGPRKRNDGPYSGEQFREIFLEPLFETNSLEIIIIDLDGVEGYSTTFLEEVFGGLARKFGKFIVLKRLEFISKDEPLLVQEIINYIEK